MAEQDRHEYSRYYQPNIMRSNQRHSTKYSERFRHSISSNSIVPLNRDQFTITTASNHHRQRVQSKRILSPSEFVYRGEDKIEIDHRHRSALKKSVKNNEPLPIIGSPDYCETPKIFSIKAPSITTEKKLPKTKKDEDKKDDDKKDTKFKKFCRKIGKFVPHSAKWLAAYSIGTILFSCCMFFAHDHLIQFALDNIMVLKRGGYVYEYVWRHPGSGITDAVASLYLFAIKNGLEYLQGEKPELEEQGPFYIRLNRVRRVLEWKNQTIKFMDRYIMQLDTNGSADVDRPYSMINFPIFMAVMFVRNFLQRFYAGFIGPPIYNAIVIALRVTGETMIERITPRQMLLERKVKIIELFDSIVMRPLKSIGLPIPDLGLFGLKVINNAYGIITTLTSGEMGPYEMYHSDERGHYVGDIASFNGKTSFPYDPPCSRMSGGEGIFFRRPLAPKLTVYFQFVCGLLHLTKKFTHSLWGAELDRYTIDEQLFNHSLARNRCYCPRAQQSPLECEGYHDVSACLLGAPVGISLPHFYLSPNLASKIDGLRPNAEQHAAYLDFDPTLALPFNAQIGIQIVTDIAPIWSVPALSKIPHTIMPILWGNVQMGAEFGLGPLVFLAYVAIHYGRFIWPLGGFPLAAFLLYKSAKYSSKSSDD